MKSFEVPHLSVEEFAQKLLGALQRMGLGKWVSFTRRDSLFEWRFSRLGTSTIRFEVLSLGRGFRAIFKEKKVSLSHLPFVGELEAAITRVIEDLGARVLS